VLLVLDGRLQHCSTVDRYERDHTHQQRQKDRLEPLFFVCFTNFTVQGNDLTKRKEWSQANKTSLGYLIIKETYYEY